MIKPKQNEEGCRKLPSSKIVYVLCFTGFPGAGNAQYWCILWGTERCLILFNFLRLQDCVERQVHHILWQQQSLLSTHSSTAHRNCQQHLQELFFYSHTKHKNTTLYFVIKLLPSSGEITNPKTQLTKNVAHINIIHTREIKYRVAHEVSYQWLYT